MKPARHKERLIALIGLAVLLFSPPLILVFDRYRPDGISALPIYLFLAWGAVILLMAWLMERPTHDESCEDDAR
ncbi:hypothetical protein [Aidingimonas lacisalsi]|uniref:hypothetical protein n=1 Tax=Aidingimonas lacisalsi TaxID=2604086 RepID=UPI0011D1810E|nr:hypothetical protein [Aidingimonas lacisalsi]